MDCVLSFFKCISRTIVGYYIYYNFSCDVCVCVCLHVKFPSTSFNTEGRPVGDGTSCFPQLAPAKGSSVQNGWLELPLRIAMIHCLTLAKQERTSDPSKQIPASPLQKLQAKPCRFARSWRQAFRGVFSVVAAVALVPAMLRNTNARKTCLT